MLALLLAALSLGLSNFAASIGIGVSGVDARTRLRVAAIFGFFETGMPIAGLLAGRSLSRALGHGAHGAGAALLIAVGVYTVIRAVRKPSIPNAAGGTAAGQRTVRLLVSGIALSIDNLAVGVAIGIYHVGLVVAVVVIGAVSTAMSLLGLELGHRFGALAGGQGELVSGLVLIGAGAAVAFGAL